MFGGGGEPAYEADRKVFGKVAQSEKKWVKLATVIGYLMTVSLAAIVLSIYYSLFWDAKVVYQRFNVVGATVASAAAASNATTGSSPAGAP